MMKLNKLGYTLGEIVMTTAIIGSLAAIAVPNFLRIKMNVNMELVKQQLRILGQNMNELYNQNNPHQYPEDILNLDGNPAEELSITASLNAIDGMGYSDHRWQTVGSPPNDFTLRRCPGEGLWGIAGDRCFLLTPSELREVMPWDGTGMDMSILADLVSFPFNMVLSDPTLSEAEKVNILSGFFTQQGFVLGRFGDNVQPSLPALFILAGADVNAAFDQLIEKVSNQLQENGIHLYINYEEGVGASGLKFTVQFDEAPDFSKANNAAYVSSYNSDTGAYMDYLESYGGPGFGQGESHWLQHQS